MAGPYRTSIAGPSLEAFTNALLQGAQVRQLWDANQRAEDEAGLRRHVAMQQLADQQAARQIVPRILAGAPETATIVPGVDPSVTETMGAPVVDAEGIARGPESSITATPGRPAVTESAHTMGSIAQAAGGPEQLATALRTPEGRQAIDTLKPITATEFEGRQRKARGRSDFERLMGEANDARSAGDELRAIDTEASAYRALAQASDNPQAALATVRELMKERLGLFKNTAQRELAQKDAKRIAPLMKAYNDDPTPQNFSAMFEGFLGAESEHYQKRADMMVQQITKDAAEQAKENRIDKRVAEIHIGVGKAMERMRRAGEPVDLGRAYREAMAQNPEATATLLTQVFEAKKAVPKPLLDAIFGHSDIPDSIAKEAHAKVSTAPDAPPIGSQQYFVRFSDEVTKLTNARKGPGTSNDTRSTAQLLQVRRDKSHELNVIEAKLGKMMPSDPSRGVEENKARPIREELSRIDDALRSRNVLPPMPTTPAAAAPPVTPGTLTPDQRRAIRVMTQTVLREAYGGRDLNAMSSEERDQVAAEVTRRMGGPPSP